MTKETEKLVYVRLCFTLGLLISAVNAITPLWSTYMKHLGGDIRDAGIALFVYFGTTGLFMFIWGHLTQRVNKYKLLITISFTSYALLTLLYFFVKTPTQLFCLQAALGAAYALQSPAYDTLYTIESQDSHGPVKWAWYSIAFYVAAAIGSLFGGYLLHSYGWNAIFTYICISSFLGAICSWLFIPKAVQS